MTLFRTIVVLIGGLLLLLAVVVLRAESARLNYEIAQIERQTGDVREQARAAEVELARLRNPMFLRQRMEQALRESPRPGGEREVPAEEP